MHQPTQRLGREARGALLALGFCLALAGTWYGLALALASAAIDSPPIQADVVLSIEALEQKLAEGHRASLRQVVILGDSMLLPGTLEKPVKTVPQQLQDQVNRRLPRAARVRVRPLALPGLGYTTFYFFAERIAKAEPDIVVLEISPMSLDESWRARGWARTDLAAWLGARRIPEALGLPLHTLGLSMDRLLWMVACVELGLDGVWGSIQREQLRVVELLGVAQETLATRFAAPSRSQFHRRLQFIRAARGRERGSDPPRTSAAGYRARYGDFLEGIPKDDISLAMLAATVRLFADAGIPTLVYLTPMNVEHMQFVGAYDPAVIALFASNTSEVIKAAGGVFLDYHALVPNEGFLDGPGHLTFEGDPNATLVLADRLARQVVRLLPPPEERD